MARREKQPWVLGVDASLTNTGAVLLPPNWRLGDWAAVRRMSYGEPAPDRASMTVLEYEEARCLRVERVAKSVGGFLEQLQVEPGGGYVRGFVEGYGYSAGGAGTHQLPELGMTMRLDLLHRYGLALHPVQEASARKQLLGKIPQGVKRKLAVQLAFGRVGAPFDADQCDAMCVANWGLSELGLTALFLGDQTGAHDGEKREGRARARRGQR